MKKQMKRLVAFTLIACLFCGLCGCAAIDEMRESQAFIDSAGRIQWQGNTYVPLTKGEFPNEETPDRMIYVTAPDVPVLLSELLASKVCVVSADKKFMLDFEGNLYCQVNVDTNGWQEGELTT